MVDSFGNKDRVIYIATVKSGNYANLLYDSTSFSFFLRIPSKKQSDLMNSVLWSQIWDKGPFQGGQYS